jgi:predicted secreted Zn-dependent protease
MNTAAIKEAHRLVAVIEPLFYTLIATAEHHQLDTIQISLPRARELQHDLANLKKRLKNILVTDATAAETTTDRHLNKIFGIN